MTCRIGTLTMLFYVGLLILKSDKFNDIKEETRYFKENKLIKNVNRHGKKKIFVLFG